MAATFYREQLMRSACLIQRLLQPHCLTIRNHIVRITVNRDDRWRIVVYIGNGRNLMRNSFLVDRASQPCDRISLAIPSSEQVGHVRDPVPVYDGRDAWLALSFVSRTIGVE